MEAYDLSRFTLMHRADFEKALTEIKAGRKVTHWMWYIFPQIEGLGRSSTAQYFAIKDINEARAFINDEYLGNNLCEISRALLSLETDDAVQVFGGIDAQKLRSSMTLFEKASDNGVFAAVIDKFYGGRRDNITLQILGF